MIQTSAHRRMMRNGPENGSLLSIACGFILGVLIVVGIVIFTE